MKIDFKYTDRKIWSGIILLGISSSCGHS
jgi:hypothetical protein